MTLKSPGVADAKRSNWLWLVVLSAIAAGLYASAFFDIPGFHF